jgi:hypothetical protein
MLSHHRHAFSPSTRFLTIDTISLTFDTLCDHRHDFLTIDTFFHHRHAFSPSTRFLLPSDTLWGYRQADRVRLMLTAMTTGATKPEDSINSAEALYLQRSTTATRGPEHTDSSKPINSDEGEAAVQPGKHQFTPQTHGEHNTSIRHTMLTIHFSTNTLLPHQFLINTFRNEPSFFLQHATYNDTMYH